MSFKIIYIYISISRIADMIKKINIHDTVLIILLKSQAALQKFQSNFQKENKLNSKSTFGDCD